jgi:putative oxidoreductase
MLARVFRGQSDLGPLLLRLALGAIFIFHGAQKLFGVWGGPGLDGIAGWMNALGFRPPYPWAVALALTEFVGGVLVLLGLFTRYAALGIACVMAVAIAKVHWGKPFAVTEGGMEFALMNLAAALCLVLTGGRALSVDRAARRDS